MKLRITQALLLLAGLGCMAIGLYRDEAAQICSKAIMICLECIGLG